VVRCHVSSGAPSPRVPQVRTVTMSRLAGGHISVSWKHLYQLYMRSIWQCSSVCLTLMKWTLCIFSDSQLILAMKTETISGIEWWAVYWQYQMIIRNWRMYYW
jgi:hypothetical protein